MRVIAYVVAGLSLVASAGAVAASRRTLSEVNETHRKTEKHADGSERFQTDQKHSVDRGEGDITDEQHVVIETKRSERGGKIITREVTKSHDAPGWKNDHKTHVLETIEKDRHGKVIRRQRSE
jgi:hypothetical protein